MKERAAQDRSDPVKRRRGRPRLEDSGQSLEATKPWLKANMSRATWFRRQREAREAEKPIKWGME